MTVTFTYMFYNGHGHGKRSGILHSDLAPGRPSSVEGEWEIP